MLWEFKSSNTTILGYDPSRKVIGSVVGELSEDFNRWVRSRGSKFSETSLSPQITLPTDDPSDVLKLARKYLSTKRLRIKIDFTKSDTFIEARSIRAGNELY